MLLFVEQMLTTCMIVLYHLPVIMIVGYYPQILLGKVRVGTQNRKVNALSVAGNILHHCYHHMPINVPIIHSFE